MGETGVCEYLFAKGAWGSLHLGDCLTVLKQFPDNHFSAVVTDPPAGISFMNLDFDSDKGGRDAWIAWLSQVMREVLRVTKPGGHAFVWAFDRTQHWTAMALEDAGWEIRQCVYHAHCTGFPKSRNPWLGVREDVEAQLRAQGVKGEIEWK